jgi:nucleoside-diphosphate-sugar epimerase
VKRVLITGATGFIGRHCLPLLTERGYEVIATNNRPLSPELKSLPNVSWVVADLLDAMQTQQLIQQIQPVQLLHLAWYAVPGRYWTASQNLDWVRGSLNLSQSFANLPEKAERRLVIAGTCAEYDWRCGYCSEETTPLNPRTLYGTAKQTLGNLLESWAAQTGLSMAWGRIFWLYGPHELPARLVPAVIGGLLQGRTVPVSHGRQIRDFLHVADVASAFVELLESTVQGAVNIGSSDPVSIERIINSIAQQIGRPELIQWDAVKVAEDDPPLIVADNRKLLQATRWQAEYKLDTGLADTIEWWENQLKIKLQPGKVKL